MTRWIQRAREASAIAQHLIARGLTPHVRPDFAIEVAIGGRVYVFVALDEARRVVP